MNVLWVTNIPFGPICELTERKIRTGGGWLSAAFDSLKDVDSLTIFVATVYPVDEIKWKNEGRHTFFLLPGGYPSEYEHNNKNNRKIWEWVREECKPDLIQIWGTEFTHGYLALQTMKNIPSVIYMQGLMVQIARHYLDGFSGRELMRSITFRDIIKIDWIRRQQGKFLRRSLYEAEMLRLSANVIVENDWCECHCKMIAPCRVFRCNLNINSAFFGIEWSASNMKPYTIMCNASSHPIKGLHILLKALSLVVKQYPQTRLYVPGEGSYFISRSFLKRMKMNGYTKYILDLIRRYKLSGNISFPGRLTAEGMARLMADSNVFVMPSSIENHSSTLIEAMIVGTPCISSYAGGVPEYLEHNVNGMIYRFEEHEILALYIIKIFDNQEFASNLGKQARDKMRAQRNTNELSGKMLEIYQSVLCQS